MPGKPIVRSLDRTLRMTAVELAELASIAEHLEFGPGAFGRRIDDDVMARCQLADLLTQRLAGLTAFVVALAEHAPPGVMVDVGGAVAGLGLAEQARRLSGSPRPPTAPAPAPSGELLLFGD